MGKRRFWGSVSGDASTEASRGGSRTIKGHIRGWDFGIQVQGYVDGDGHNCFEIWTTGGSNDDRIKEHILTISEGGYHYDG